MTGYRAPKKRLHREFLYLNHDTILNSLSALEAGKVDEIIQKVIEAKEGGFEGSVGAGPVKGDGGKKKKASIEEELVKTRTWFPPLTHGIDTCLMLKRSAPSTHGT